MVQYDIDMDIKDIVKQGSVDIIIDEIVSCLKDSETSELKETVVFKIECCTTYC